MNAIPRYNRNLSAEEIRELVGVSPFIIEIGCNDGEDTARFLATMPNAHIVCFEPDHRALERFCLKDHPQVVLHPLGVTHRCGTQLFWQSTGVVPGSTAPCAQDWDYSGGFSQPTGHLVRDKVVKFKPPIEMHTVTLDRFYDTYQHPVDFIWADTQGSEAKMILGGHWTLLSTRYLYTEFYQTPQYERQPNLDALLAFLPDFDLLAVYGDNALFKNRCL